MIRWAKERDAFEFKFTRDRHDSGSGGGSGDNKDESDDDDDDDDDATAEDTTADVAPIRPTACVDSDTRLVVTDSAIPVAPDADDEGEEEDNDEEEDEEEDEPETPPRLAAKSAEPCRSALHLSNTNIKQNGETNKQTEN